MYFHYATNTKVVKIDYHYNATTNRVISSKVGSWSRVVDVSKHYGVQNLRIQ